MSGGPRTVVTGAAGLVGRAVVDRLLARGHHVIPVTRAKWIRSSVVLDLAKSGDSLVDEVGTRPDAVVHLAAAVPHSARYPDDDATAQVTRSIDDSVARACAAWAATTVYSSTCGLYDRFDTAEKTEESEIAPRSPYFTAKARGEGIFSDLGACVMRLSAPYGLGMRRSVVLARFIESARTGQTLEVWGSGLREQDFVAATDIADFVTRALAEPVAGTWNVAKGRPTTMIDLARVVTQVVGAAEIRLGIRPDPEEKATARYSVSAAQGAFDWQATTPERDGIQDLASLPFAD